MVAFKFIVGTIKLMHIIEVCPYCGAEVKYLPPDGIAYCTECEHIVEGEKLKIQEDQDV